MPTIPESTKVSLQQRLSEHARKHWPQLADVKVRYRGTFAYVSGALHDGELLPLLDRDQRSRARQPTRYLYVLHSELVGAERQLPPLVSASTHST